MKRKALSILLSLVMIITTIVPVLNVASAAVWTGTTSVPSMSGGVYQIATGENLAWFAYAVNAGNNLIKGKLTADIQLNSNGSTDNNWTPIGTEQNPFMGTFDGNGHTVSGLYVNSDQVGVGLFGYVSYNSAPLEDVSAEYIVGTKEYTILNLNVTNANVNGKQNVGGIVGYANNAGIIDCSFSGTVNGTENSVGGIVGWATINSVINQCSASGSVSGHQRVGGIVGFCNGNSVVTKSFGNVNVSGYLNVGGIVGTLSAGSMLGCFFFGSVSADDRAGGLVGYSAFGRMMGGYTVSTITNNASGKDFGGVVGVTYDGSYSSLFYSFEDSGVDGPEGIGRTVSEMMTSDFVKEVNHSAPYFCFDYMEINNGYPVLTWMLKLDVWAGDQVMPKTNSSGTYLISKPAELAWFAGLVNGTLSGFEANPAANATVTDNLLFNINVYDDSFGITEWVPIGTSERPYTGTFNGAGYNIAGINISNTSATNTGLFGYVGTGTVTGVNLVDGLIRGKENVGGIIGYLASGSVINCVCNSEIQGDRAVGGIVGNLGTSAAKITTCAMIGTVTGTNVSNEQSYLQNVGGLAGYNNRASITKSFSSAHINAPLARFVGGIVGNSSSGSITSSYSTSTVVGFDRVGGIAGNNNNGTFTKCYTAGKVSGTSQVGIAFGATSGTGVTYCFYDESFKSISNTVTGASAKTPAQMTGSNSVYNLGLGSDFKATADDTYFYYYPQIYTMSYSSINAIKNASVESVRRVQNKYIARVEIDGRTDTYFETLDSAFNFASNAVSSLLPTVFLVRDMELTSTLNISANIAFFGENGAILSRASSLTDAMIRINNNVTIGSSLYGYDDAPDFFIDGNDIAGTTSAIVVSNGSTLRIEPGVCIENCRTATTAVRGAAVNSVGGTVVVTGGKFERNISKTVGGAIYNENGTVNVTGGEFTYCEATQGCAIYNNNGIVNVSGGRFAENIATQYGGAIAGYGVYSETYITGKAQIVENQATYGGALAVQNYGTLEINGGTITGNRAYSQGGALYIGSGAEAHVTGGTFTSNIAQNPVNPSLAAYGNGIYNDGDLMLKGSIQIPADNDIYLPSGRYVTVADRLTCQGHAAVITPQVYAEGAKVLDGSAMTSFYNKFGVTQSGWHILASGKITNLASQNVALLTKNGAYSIEFISLYDAFAAVGKDDTAIITVIANNVISDTIPVNGDVTLVCDDESYVSMRNGSFHGVMFDVQPDAILRFGDVIVNPDQQAQSDYKSGTVTQGQMIIDGGSKNTGVIGAAAVNVQTKGQFYMYDDAIIRNCSNTTTGTVTVSGTMHMYGGTITGNAGLYSGGVYVRSSGVLNTYGGVIAGNTSDKNSEAVYSLGKVTRNINSYKYYYIETLYDEDTGDIIGMADPVYRATQKTDVLIGEGERVYLEGNLIYSGESSTDIYVRNLEKIPESTGFTINEMCIALKSYSLGAVAVTGTNVIDWFIGYVPDADGYYVMSDGKLGINKLVPKDTSGYRIQRAKSVISGIQLGNNKVSTVVSKFVNSSTLIRVVNAKGTPLRNTNTVTTGCKIRLVDASGRVVDEVSIVVYGDVNADEKIDGCDAVLINAIAANMLNSTNASAAELEAGDVNHDGSVTAIDAEQVASCGVLLNTIEQI